MAKQFEFADFIDEFKVEFKVLSNQAGDYDDKGKWIEGEVVLPKTMIGIILPASTTFGGSDDLKHEENGVYSEKDRKIYTIEPLEKGQKIEYENQIYTIDSNKDYSAYADVFIYFAKGVNT